MIRLFFTIGLILSFCGCERRVPHWLTDTGERTPAERGRTLVGTYGCNACHEIDGISEYPGHIGPSLTSWSKRIFIAGRLPNQEQMLVDWLMKPQSVNPGTAMPDLGVTEPEARDMAAYLFSQ